MLGKLFGVPQRIHESVVETALQSQRIIIADMVKKNGELLAERADMEATIRQAFSDLRQLQEQNLELMKSRNVAPPAPAPGQTVAHSVRRPAYAQSSIAGRHALKRPAPKEADSPSAVELLGDPA